MILRPESRREFLKLSGRYVLGGLAAGLVWLRYITDVEPGWIEVTQVPLRLPRLTQAFQGLRLVQISDIHMGRWMNAQRLQEIVEIALSQQPDLIALTGDYLVGHEWSPRHGGWVSDLTTALRPLAQYCPTFGILGNHDYWTSAYAVREMFAGAGIIELSNAVYTLEKEGEQFHLAGVDDIWEGYDRLDRVLEKLPAAGAAVLLAHEPDFADVSASTGRFDLQLSGHTHGGQVSIPFIGPPVLPYLGKKYPSGLYQVGSMYQYTNRGVGMARLALRFNCRPEITVFTLTC